MSMQWPPKVNTMLENAWKNASTPGGGARAALATVRGCQLAQDMPIMYHAV
jgi:formiminotetrahydrofolate cyclodeaminase